MSECCLFLEYTPKKHTRVRNLAFICRSSRCFNFFFLTFRNLSYVKIGVVYLLLYFEKIELVIAFQVTHDMTWLEDIY